MFSNDELKILSDSLKIFRGRVKFSCIFCEREKFSCVFCDKNIKADNLQSVVSCNVYSFLLEIDDLLSKIESEIK